MQIQPRHSKLLIVLAAFTLNTSCSDSEGPSVSGTFMNSAKPVSGATISIYLTQNDWGNNVAPEETLLTDGAGHFESYNDKFRIGHFFLTAIKKNVSAKPLDLAPPIFAWKNFSGGETNLVFGGNNLYADLIDTKWLWYGSTTALPCEIDNYLIFKPNFKISFYDGENSCPGMLSTTNVGLPGGCCYVDFSPGIIYYIMGVGSAPAYHVEGINSDGSYMNWSPFNYITFYKYPTPKSSTYTTWKKVE